MPIEAIIVDDETQARLNLATLLQLHCPQVEIVALCANANEARKAFLQHSPHLLFLDISMPGESGLELLESLQSFHPHVVFTTAYAEHAIKAFELRAIDYLLKPILSERLIDAVSRVKPEMPSSQNWSRLTASLQSMPTAVPLPTQDGVELVDPDEVVRLVANGPQTLAFLTNGNSIILSKHLKAIEALLDERFARTHHAHVVNIQHIRRYTKTDGGFLVMSDGSEVEISRRKKAGILKLLEQRFG